MNLMLKIICVAVVILVGNVLADIETNDVEAVFAPNGAMLLYYELSDDDTDDDYNSPANFYDKKGNLILANIEIGGLKNYEVEGFDGKNVVLVTDEGMSDDNEKIMTFKITKKELIKVGEQTIANINNITVFKSFIAVEYSNAGQEALNGYDKKLAKKKFDIPFSDASIEEIYENGVVVQNYEDANSLTITYTKKGKPLAVHSIPLPDEGTIRYSYDSKGGFLYWVRTGSPGNRTNSPIIYVNKKNKKIADYLRLDGDPTYWHIEAWNGKMLYITDDNYTKVSAHKIGKTSLKVNEIDGTNYEEVRLYKSKVFYEEKVGGDEFVSEYDKNLKKRKSTSALYHEIRYIGEGVYAGYIYFDNGDDGDDVTVNIIKGKKVIINQNFFEPY